MENKAGTKRYPPGMIFAPTDEELLVHYLMGKMANPELKCPMIADADIYSHHPKELIDAYSPVKEKACYVFSKRERKYPLGDRPSRTAKGGYWKASGKDNNLNFGFKRSLSFHEGNHSNPQKTNWLMLEYHIMGNQIDNKDTSDSKKRDDWVLCRIYYHSKGKSEKRIKMLQGESSEAATQRQEDQVVAVHEDMAQPQCDMVVGADQLSTTTLDQGKAVLVQDSRNDQLVTHPPHYYSMHQRHISPTPVSFSDSHSSISSNQNMLGNVGSNLYGSLGSNLTEGDFNSMQQHISPTPLSSDPHSSISSNQNMLGNADSNFYGSLRSNLIEGDFGTTLQTNGHHYLDGGDFNGYHSVAGGDSNTLQTYPGHSVAEDFGNDDLLHPSMYTCDDNFSNFLESLLNTSDQDMNKPESQVDGMGIYCDDLYDSFAKYQDFINQKKSDLVRLSEEDIHVSHTNNERSGERPAKVTKKLGGSPR